MFTPKFQNQKDACSWSWRTWKQRSLLVTTFLLLLLLCMFVLFCCYGFTRSLRSEEKKQQLISHAETCMQGIMDNTLSLFEGVSQSITQFGMNRSFYSLMFTERLSDSPANSVMLQLSGIVKEYPLMQEMAVYFKKTDRVVTSSYLVSNLSVSKYADIINAYFNKEVITSDLEFYGRTSHLFTYDKKLILARTLPFDNENALATAFCIINTEKLFDSTIKDLTVYVFDQNHNPIFLDEIPYPSESYRYYETMTSQKTTFLKNGDHSVYAAASQDTGWTYLYLIDTDPFFLPFRGVWKSTLAHFLWFVVPLALIMVFILTCFLMRPYWFLLQNLKGHEETLPLSPAAFSNEASYINAAISRLYENTTLLQTAITDVSYDVTSRLFRDILMGDQLDYVYVEKVLTNAGSSFSLNAPYFVCVLQKAGEPLNLQERKTLLNAFKKAILALQTKSDILIHSMTIDTDVVVICSYPHKTSPLVLAKIRDELRLLFQNLNSKTGLSILSENGRVYYSILDLVFSYHDAKTSLEEKYARQIAATTDSQELSAWKTEEEPRTASKISTPRKLILLSIESNMGLILDYIANQETENASTLYQRLIDDILAISEELDEAVNLCESVILQLTRQLIQHPVFCQLPLPENLIYINAEFSEIKELPDLVERMKEQGAFLISQLTEVIRKEQNHYLQAAREYIAQSYFDSSLSLTSLSQILKVNDSYLSKLFKSNLGKNFVDYLNNYRILKSKKLLAETDTPIKDIAEATGFNSVQNYIRVFRKYTDMTPGQFRIAQRQLSEKTEKETQT